MIWLLGVIVFLLVVILGGVTRLHEKVDARDIDHAKCISHVSHYTGNEFAAQVLRAAAEDYDSATGQARARILANTQYKPGDDTASIPALWLEHRAGELVAEVEVR